MILLKIIGSAIGSFLAKAAGTLAIFYIGKASQRRADLEATQTTEQEAADAKARVAVDPAYRDELRDRYTADQ